MAAALIFAAYALPYGLRARTLAARGRSVPRWRMWCFGLGLVALALATSAPLNRLASGRLVTHMAEHLAIADVAAPLLVLGFTGPLLAPLLRLRAVDRLRALSHPAVAFPLWALNLGFWHLAFAYDGAVAHDTVHVVEHGCFLLAAMNLWMPLFGPLPKPAWFGVHAQLAYVVAVRLTGAALANAFLWSGSLFYSSYDHLADQSAAGAVMMVEESLATIALFGWLFFKWMREGEERQAIEELAAAHAGEIDPRRVARAVAAGRGDDLRRRILGRDGTPTSSA